MDKEIETQALMELVRKMLAAIGEDPNRPGLLNTPARVVKMWSEIFCGYDQSNFPKVTKFKNGDDGIQYDQMLIDIGYFFSHCEHHMVPFFGSYYFGYIPGEWIIGASKIGRIVDYYSARLQVAERLVHDIIECIEERIKPRGSILVMTGRHLCKEMRGLKKHNSPFEAVAVRGYFLENRRNCKDEFLSRIK